jgi:hypothetical protein
LQCMDQRLPLERQVLIGPRAMCVAQKPGHLSSIERPLSQLDSPRHLSPAPATASSLLRYP